MPSYLKAEYTRRLQDRQVDVRMTLSGRRVSLKMSGQRLPVYLAPARTQMVLCRGRVPGLVDNIPRARPFFV